MSFLIRFNVVVLLVLLLETTAELLKVQQCTDTHPLVHVKSISTELGTGTTLDKNSKITIKYSSPIEFTKNDRYIAKLNVEKWLFVTYVTVPESMFGTVKKSSNDHEMGSKYLGDRTFDIGCYSLGKYMECPLPVGDKGFIVDLKEMIEKASKLAGTVGRFFGSGWVKIKAHVTRPNGELLLCLNLELNIKL